MSAGLHVLPDRTAGAAENMATDFLLLQRYPDAGASRFRHYGWRAPAFTFGYAQKCAAVRELVGRGLRTPPSGPMGAKENLAPHDTVSATAGFGVPALHGIELCRRPTGGGIVDHREDWTYALVIPRGHPLEDVRASQSYRAIHEALAGALKCQDAIVALKPAVEESGDANAGVCFQRAEIFDVVHARTGAKVAGAAQKRNKHGLLFQGSIWRPAVGVEIDWDVFQDDFTAEIGNALQAEAQPTPWPEFNEDELSGLTEQYSSAEWLEFR
jgi:lipoate-protein ligase A